MVPDPVLSTVAGAVLKQVAALAVPRLTDALGLTRGGVRQDVDILRREVREQDPSLGSWQEAMSWLRYQEPAKARDALVRLVAQQPLAAAGHLLLALLEARERRYSGLASDALRRAVELNPYLVEATLRAVPGGVPATSQVGALLARTEMVTRPAAPHPAAGGERSGIADLSALDDRLRAHELSRIPPKDAAWAVNLSLLIFGNPPRILPVHDPGLAVPPGQGARTPLTGLWMSCDPFTGRQVAVLTFLRRPKPLAGRVRTLVAVDCERGDLLWQRDVRTLELVGPAAIVATTLDRAPTLEAYDPRTGQPVRRLSPLAYELLISPESPRRLWPEGWRTAAAGTPPPAPDRPQLSSWVTADPLGVCGGRTVARSLSTEELNREPFAWGSTRFYRHLLVRYP